MAPRLPGLLIVASAGCQPTDAAWVPIARENGRSEASTVWTGEQMLVWGGWESPETGAAYDLASDSWSPMATGGPRASWAASVWTGEELVVWGGYRTNEEGSGGIYSPERREWRSMPVVDLPIASHKEPGWAVWTGSEMLVWGGLRGYPSPSYVSGSGAAFEPSSGRWRLLSDVGAPRARTQHATAWTGQEMVVWGGYGSSREDGLIDPGIFDCGPGCSGGEPLTFADGARYDPALDRWTPMSSEGAPPAGQARAVWTGTEMVVLAGREVAAYDPTTDRWRAMDPPRSSGSPPVWTGSDVLLWSNVGSRRPRAGSALDPETGVWAALPNLNVPRSRAWESVVWADDRLIVWGGQGCDPSPCEDGAMLLDW